MKSIALGVGALALIVLALFSAKVFSYYRGIKSGALDGLPQFAARFTVGSRNAEGGSRNEFALTGSSDDPALGSEKAPLTIIEFGDFECPFSREAFTTARSLMSEFGGEKVRFIFRDFPLETIHPRARAAAIAGSCAGAQGKFWQMHDKLFQNNTALEEKDLKFYAEQIGLDAREFASCRADPATAADIDADLKAGAAAGVRGTPTFFFNGQKVEGAIPLPIFKSLIERPTSSS